MAELIDVHSNSSMNQRQFQVIGSLCPHASNLVGNGLQLPVAPGHSKLFKHDLELGGKQVHDFGAGHLQGEFVFVPRKGTDAEDDGRLIGYVINQVEETTDFVILDAQNFAGGPQAVIHVPHRIPPGFHGNWVPT